MPFPLAARHASAKRVSQSPSRAMQSSRVRCGTESKALAFFFPPRGGSRRQSFGRACKRSQAESEEGWEMMLRRAEWRTSDQRRRQALGTCLMGNRRAVPGEARLRRQRGQGGGSGRAGRGKRSRGTVVLSLGVAAEPRRFPFRVDLGAEGTPKGWGVRVGGRRVGVGRRRRVALGVVGRISTRSG